MISRKPVSEIMNRGWYIGQEKIWPTTSEQDTSLTKASTLFSKSGLVNLNEMLQHIKCDVEKKPIPIRPPRPRTSTQSVRNWHTTTLCEAIPKSIIRQRSLSLPPTTEKKRKCRTIGVRFIDSLGLDLENIKFFKSGDEPSIPHHVSFKLLMGAELASGNHMEISLPYLKPLFDQQTSQQPGFLHRLYKHKVCLERVLVFEFCVIGIAQVLNLDFEKDVTARYSFTEWKSCAETKASWVSTSTKNCEGDSQLTCDTFRFHLPVPPFLKPGAMLEFAIKYTVCGAEYWDNNDGQNYKLICHSYTHTVPKECEDSMVHFF
ncbi:protein phosphatase 1, regulatory subunit 3Da [Stigmatopora nigra]